MAMNCELVIFHSTTRTGLLFTNQVQNLQMKIVEVMNIGKQIIQNY